MTPELLPEPAESERFLFTLADFDSRSPKGTWLDERIAHLSASSLGMFRRCPEQWRQRYLLGRKEPPGEGLVIGNFFHGAMEFNYHRKIRTREDRKLEEVIQYLGDKVIPDVVDKAGGPGEIKWDTPDPGKALERARSDALRVTASYYRTVVPRIQPFETEQRLEWHIRGVPVPVIGYLDVVAEGGATGRIIDTKTGKQAVKRVKPSWQMQGMLYATWSGMPVEYHSLNRAAMPTINTPLEAPELLVRASQKESVNLQQTIVTMVEMIEWLYATHGPNEPWPTLGRYADWSMSSSPCGYCGYRRDCVAWQ